jgi:hypothetical protein
MGPDQGVREGFTPEQAQRMRRSMRMHLVAPGSVERGPGAESESQRDRRE